MCMKYKLKEYVKNESFYWVRIWKLLFSGAN